MNPEQPLYPAENTDGFPVTSTSGGRLNEYQDPEIIGGETTHFTLDTHHGTELLNPDGSPPSPLTEVDFRNLGKWLADVNKAEE